MSSSSTSHSDADRLPAPDAVDEELASLPGPPRGQRLLAMASMAAVVLAATGLLLQLREDVAYSFADSQRVDLGDVNGIVLSELETNRYVRVHGTPMLSRTVRFERAISGRQYAVFPLAGQRQIFVQVPVEALQDPARASQGEFSGRLLTFGQLGGRFRVVREYLSRDLGLPVTAESFVVLAEEPPSSYGWALAMAALCLAIIALTVWLALRWFKPIAAASRSPARATVD